MIIHDLIVVVLANVVFVSNVCVLPTALIVVDLWVVPLTFEATAAIDASLTAVVALILHQALLLGIGQQTVSLLSVLLLGPVHGE